MIVSVLQYFPYAVGVVLLLATLIFLVQFIIPSRQLKRQLDAAIAALNKISIRPEGSVEPDEIKAAMVSDELRHLWREYAETLHPQHDESGRHYRATAMAEVFFAEQALVETPLKTAFYKHLPGILTGLGIIGTFSGLIYGLNGFQITEDPKSVRESLATLIQGVGHAFIISAIAISLAMLCTWWTNRELTLRYRQVEQLCQLIDSFFNAGAGEEYLARLVEAAEKSPLQSIQLKDALVSDLKQLLTELTERQIREMSSGIVQAFVDSLKEPMERIARVVEGASAKQNDAVNSMLGEVLSKFSCHMEEMFGAQLRGMSESLLPAVKAIEAVASRFDQLAANMDEAGQNAAAAMAGRLNEAIASMEARQGMLNQEMREFVSQIRVMVSQSQTESSQKLHETVASLGNQVAGMIAQLENTSRAHSTAQAQSAADISRHVETLIAQLLKMGGELHSNVTALTFAVSGNIERMNSGAERLAVAANDFAKAGQSVAGVMDAARDTTGKIQSTAQSLSAAAASVQQMFADYQKTSDAFAGMLIDLKTTIGIARKETGLTVELANQIRAAAEELAKAQLQSGDYLQGINQVLADTHREFGLALRETLGNSNQDFQHELSSAVSKLNSSIKDLGTALDELPRAARP